MVERTKQHSETLYIDYKMFLKGINRLIEKINKSGKKYDRIYAIPRGGLVVGVYLSHRLKLPLSPIADVPNTLVVDDILDTGNTLARYYDCNDCAVLVTKQVGLNRCPNTMYAFGTADNMWAQFPWEVE